MAKNKIFVELLNKSIAEQPDMGTYIHLCRVLQESGCSRREIISLFNSYMPEEEYDKPEKGELIDYLVSIAKVV